MELFDIPLYPNYKITKCGKVFSLYYNRFVSTSLSSRGYISVKLSRNGKSIHTSIHRLIALAFIGIPENEKMVVNHKNGDKLDNSIENLEWCTIQENVLHYYKYLQKFSKGNESAVGLSNGIPPRVQSNSNKKNILDKDQYKEIYSLCEKKIPVRFIFRKFPDIDLGHIKAVYNFINGSRRHYLNK